MNKFIGKKATRAKKKTVEKVTVIETTPKAEVIKKGEDEFVICPKCGWIHEKGTKKCRFCWAKIGE